MYARLLIYENVDLDLTDWVRRWMEASAVDPFARARTRARRPALQPQAPISGGSTATAQEVRFARRPLRPRLLRGRAPPARDVPPHHRAPAVVTRLSDGPDASRSTRARRGC